MFIILQVSKSFEIWWVQKIKHLLNSGWWCVWSVITQNIWRNFFARDETWISSKCFITIFLQMYNIHHEEEISTYCINETEQMHYSPFLYEHYTTQNDALSMFFRTAKMIHICISFLCIKCQNIIACVHVIYLSSAGKIVSFSWFKIFCGHVVIKVYSLNMVLIDLTN